MGSNGREKSVSCRANASAGFVAGAASSGGSRKSSTGLMICAVAVALFVFIAVVAAAEGHGTDPNPVTVIPRKVTTQGHFISHHLDHYHSDLLPNGHISTAGASVDYLIPLPDQDPLHVHLVPGARLTRASTVVETIGGSDGIQIKDKGGGAISNRTLRGLRSDRLCHYTGTVKGDDRSRVALSACDGLSGYIRTKRGYYLIQPISHSRHKLATATHAWGDPHPHVLFPFEDNPRVAAEKHSRQMSSADQIEEDNPSLFYNRWSRDLANDTKSANQSIPAEQPDTEELYIETMVVLDNTMIKHHKPVDLENYILTVFNMAHSLFHDSSLGKNINLAIVRLVRLEQEEYELNLALNRNPTKTLESFVDWQQKINPKEDTHPNHHDMALLITRLDVCDDSKMCGWLGAARIGGVCDPNHQVAICQDVGLRLGFVIAHQIGHALGLPHDTMEDCGCKDHSRGGSFTIMSPRMSPRTTYWSNCSRDALKHFLDSGFGTCLHDPPTEHSFELTDVLPGVMYDADYQCRTLMGPNAAQCMTGIDCNNLICYIEDKGCVETHAAVAPGTKCGDKKWCIKGKCVFVGHRPGAVHGGWGDWSEWSRCTRTCGSGVASQTRHCNNPLPSGGGRYCFGEHMRHRICSTDPCDMNEPSFRDVQCAEFNSWVYPEDSKIHQWKNYPIHDENPCLLFCVNDEGTVASLRPRVIDGTKCQYGMRDICINGLCREIPCDMDLESNAVEDRCGVCRGDGTSCRLVEGRKHFSCAQYVVSRRFTQIPTGAINIKIEETMPSASRIQLRDWEGNSIFCAGDDFGMYSVPGSKVWVGLIRAEQEAVSIPGPTEINLTVWIDLKQDVTIKYSYGLPVPRKLRHSTRFAWDYVQWSRCSAECGVGTQEALPVCVEEVTGQVDTQYCYHLPKPHEQIRACELAPCTPRWFMGDWQPCICKRKIQERMVSCIRPTGEGEGELDIIDDAQCVAPKPKRKQKCKCHSNRRHITGKQQLNIAEADLDEVQSPLEVKQVAHSSAGRSKKRQQQQPLIGAVMYVMDTNERPRMVAQGDPNSFNELNKTAMILVNQSILNSNLANLINQTSFQNASAPFNVTKANLTSLLKNESSVDIDTLACSKNMTKVFDLSASKNSTVIDFDNITRVELKIHADLVNGEFPNDVPMHSKHLSRSWYTLVGRDAMHFINQMQTDSGSDNKTQI